MMRKDLVKSLVKIVSCLEQAKGWVWYREIARRTGLHHKTVSRLVEKHLTMFVDIQTMEPFNVRMVRLKQGVDGKSVFRYLSVKEKIDSPS